MVRITFAVALTCKPSPISVFISQAPSWYYSQSLSVHLHSHPTSPVQGALVSGMDLNSPPVVASPTLIVNRHAVPTSVPPTLEFAQLRLHHCRTERLGAGLWTLTRRLRLLLRRLRLRSRGSRGWCGRLPIVLSVEARRSWECGLKSFKEESNEIYVRMMSYDARK